LTRIPIKRALVSVFDKAGLPDLARALHEAGVEIVSTGTTAAAIEKIGIPVTKVEAVTGFPECLDGRVKTLHPKVHAGLLADMSNEDHVTQLDVLAIEPFQLLVSNLYPFEETVAKGSTPDETIEQIDIGGPAMVRAASKNHGSVAVITSPAQYGDVHKALADGGFTIPTTPPSRPGSPPATHRTRPPLRPAGRRSPAPRTRGPRSSAMARTRTSAPPYSPPLA
jgi:phosphoribosylaminoimidazolecarboxamide formyltransferase/IMP cyclohydrolase